MSTFLSLLSQLPLFFYDYTGAILSLTCTLLYIQNRPASWILCMTSNLLHIYLLLKTGIYGDMGLEVLYLFMSIYGLYYWLWGSKTHDPAPIQHITLQHAILLCAASLPLYTMIYQVLLHHTDSNIAALDTLCTTLSCIAQWLMCRRIIETWSLWFIIDILFATLFYKKQLYGHVLLNLMYLPLALYGYRYWKKIQAQYR
jgi:nicotinamide mononucleotide transporter